MQGIGDVGWARLDGRDNALNALRLLLAIAVIVGHSYLTVTGREPTMPVHRYAVDGFFAISGYLIASSRTRTPLRPYFVRRAARIFPGLWVCLLATAFVFAPLSAIATGAPTPWGEAVRYVLSNATSVIGQLGIGGMLDAVPYPVYWNASLWSIPFELLCYLMLGLAFAITRERAFVAATTLAVCSLVEAAAWTIPSLQGVQDAAFPRVAAFFAAGAWLYLVRDRLPRSGTVAAVCALAVAALCLAPVAAFSTLAPLPLTYVLLWLGVELPTRLGARHDLSFGLYLYAFPAQQLLVVASLRTPSPLTFSVLVMALVTPLAAASWMLVERPALRAAGRITRGSRIWREPSHLSEGHVADPSRQRVAVEPADTPRVEPETPGQPCLRRPVSTAQDLNVERSARAVTEQGLSLGGDPAELVP